MRYKNEFIWIYRKDTLASRIFPEKIQIQIIYKIGSEPVRDEPRA
jgi:hypothetical protein